MSRVKIIYGTAGWGSLPMETSQGYLDILRRYNVKDIDTAYRYVRFADLGMSEYCGLI